MFVLFLRIVSDTLDCAAHPRRNAKTTSVKIHPRALLKVHIDFMQGQLSFPFFFLVTNDTSQKHDSATKSLSPHDKFCVAQLF